MIGVRHQHLDNTDVEPWIDELCASLYRLACRRPAVARLIGLWINSALERGGPQ